MKNILLILAMIAISISYSLAQSEITLEKILEKYSKVTSIQYECTYCLNEPIEHTFTNVIKATRNPLDTTCGFNYFFYTPTKQRGIGDSWNSYYGDTHYSSYKGEITKRTKKEEPKYFIDTIWKNKDGSIKGISPSVVKSPIMFNYTLFSLEKEIIANLKDSSAKLIIKNDTLIGNVKCFQFEFVRHYYTTKYCVDNKTLYPVFHQVRNLDGQLRTAYINNFNGEAAIPLSYYADENILPSNGAEIKYLKPENINWAGKEAPMWSLPILNNDRTLELANLKGKIVILDFTATWCKHCIEATEVMNNLYERYKNNDSVVLLSIFCSDVDSKELIQKFAQKQNIRNKILYNAAKAGEMYHISGYPALFIVDGSGKIVRHYSGFSADLEKSIIEEISLLTKPFAN